MWLRCQHGHDLLPGHISPCSFCQEMEKSHTHIPFYGNRDTLPGISFLEKIERGKPLTSWLCFLTNFACPPAWQPRTTRETEEAESIFKQRLSLHFWPVFCPEAALVLASTALPPPQRNGVTHLLCYFHLYFYNCKKVHTVVYLFIKIGNFLFDLGYLSRL